MKVCKKFIISGFVQGVCYRIRTQQQAIQLKLTGYVENLEDGRVQAEFYGEEENIDVMQEWLWLGPVMAKVENIEVMLLNNTMYSEFEVR